MQAQPQGIMAALGRNIPQPPMQAPQMPSPMGGMGPSRAGLGNVQDRVDAYRNNPEALQQQYAVSQDMLDLLALQQIKSEKDAAIRNMQLQMAQQGPQPTVKQQLEGQVMDMTKQDLAKQTGMVGQQQEQQKQQAMQQLMSGIARAPGAANVMPARMAGGGIIAFQGQGAVPMPVAPRPQIKSSYDYKELRDAAAKLGIPFSIYMPRQEYEETKQRLNEYLRTGQLPPAQPKVEAEPEPRQLGASPEEMAGEAMVPPKPSGVLGLLTPNLSQAASTVKRVVMGDRPKFYSEELGYGPPPPVPQQVNQAEFDRVKQQTQQGPQFDISSPATAIPQLEAQLDRVGPSERAGIERELVRLRQRLAAQQAAQPEPGPQAAQVSGAGLTQPGQEVKPDIAPGLGVTVPDRRGAGIAGMPVGGGFGQRLQTAIESQFGAKPEEAAATGRTEAEQYFRDAMAKKRAAQEAGIKSLTEQMGERFDPELQRRERLKRFLLGASGQRFGDVVGAGASGSLAYQQQQAEQQRAQQAALQKMQEELAGMDLTEKSQYYTAGEARRKSAEEAQRGALTAGANVFGTLQQAETAEAGQAAATQRAREQNLSAETVAKINAAAQDRPGEKERVTNEYLNRLAKYGKTNAEQYLNAYLRASGGDTREENIKLTALKSRQTALLKELEDLTIPTARKAQIRQELSRVQADIDKIAGLEPQSSATPMYAVNPKTKERIMSTDGGQTWTPAK